MVSLCSSLFLKEHNCLSRNLEHVMFYIIRPYNAVEWSDISPFYFFVFLFLCVFPTIYFSTITLLESRQRQSYRYFSSTCLSISSLIPQVDCFGSKFKRSKIVQLRKYTNISICLWGKKSLFLTSQVPSAPTWSKLQQW